MQDDGNLVLYPANTGDTPTDAYWRTNTFGFGSKFHLYLNSTAILLFVNGTSLHRVSGGTIYDASSSSVPNNSVIYRSTLDSDGIFRFYSHAYDEGGDFNVSTLWEALKDPCEVKTFCGFNSYCTFNDNQSYCVCLPGTEFVYPNDWSLGCQRNFSEVVCTGGKENEAFYRIQIMENMKWGDRPYAELPMSTKEECSRSCLEDCNCGAALFDSGYCTKQSLALRCIRRNANENYMAIFTEGITNLKSSNETDKQKMPVLVIVHTV